jgi:hypothetical protein
LLLREGGEPTDRIDVAAVTDARLESGLRHGAHLNRIVEACIRRHDAELTSACTAAEHAMGRDAVRDTLIVAAGFNGITRVADATGIPLDPTTSDETRELRRHIIDGFDYSAKSARYDQA